MKYLILLFFNCALADNIYLKVFGSDSYHPTKYFEQKYFTQRRKNGRDLWENITFFEHCSRNRVQIVWSKAFNKPAWQITNKNKAQVMVAEL